ncbi:MAG TPA: aspartate/glutamate racemase family protein [Chitinophagaceae bacterium]|nr:aspartate/glutamate racemase family protein [Chitinophagaceae bacterium]
MKTIGLIGGISWLSSMEYYRLLNEEVNKRLGGVHAGKIILYSVNFAEIKVLTAEDRWEEIAMIVNDVARKLEQAGADCILIGANTMHKIADEIQQNIGIPIIHIAEATALQVKKQHLKKVALLGTKYTMQLDFYKDKLSAQGITAIIPEDDEEIEFINTAIYEEMGKGIFLPATKQKILDVINSLIKKGAEGIVLGCTEIPLLIKQEDCSVPVFDTTQIHSTAAVNFALSNEAILAHNYI